MELYINKNLIVIMSERKNSNFNQDFRAVHIHSNSFKYIGELENRMNSVLNSSGKDKMNQNEPLKINIDNLYFTHQQYKEPQKKSKQQISNSSQSFRSSSKFYELEKYNQKLIEELDQVTKKLYSSSTKQNDSSLIQNQNQDLGKHEEFGTYNKLNFTDLIDQHEESNDQMQNQQLDKDKHIAQLKLFEECFKQEKQKLEVVINEQQREIEKMKILLKDEQERKSKQYELNSNVKLEKETIQRHIQREELLQKKIGILLDEIQKKNEQFGKKLFESQEDLKRQIKSLQYDLHQKLTENLILKEEREQVYTSINSFLLGKFFIQ